MCSESALLLTAHGPKNYPWRRRFTNLREPVKLIIVSRKVLQQEKEKEMKKSPLFQSMMDLTTNRPELGLKVQFEINEENSDKYIAAIAEFGDHGQALRIDKFGKISLHEDVDKAFARKIIGDGIVSRGSIESWEDIDDLISLHFQTIA